VQVLGLHSSNPLLKFKIYLLIHCDQLDKFLKLRTQRNYPTPAVISQRLIIALTKSALFITCRYVIML